MIYGITADRFVSMLVKAADTSNGKNILCFDGGQRLILVLKNSKEALHNGRLVLNPLSLTDIAIIARSFQPLLSQDNARSGLVARSLLLMSERKEAKEVQKNVSELVSEQIHECVSNYFRGSGFQTNKEIAREAARLYGT